MKKEQEHRKPAAASPRRRSTRKAAAAGRAKMLKMQAENDREDFESNDDESIEMEEEDEEDTPDDMTLDETASSRWKSPRKSSSSLKTMIGQQLHSVTPSPPPRKSSSIASGLRRGSGKPSPSTSPAKKWNPKSIALRGLPRGALARCPVTGFTVRTLDGISPLKDAKASTSRDLLPGRLLVVDGPPTMTTGGDDDIVGKTFESAKDFESAFQATYAMEAVADPAFAPFEFVQARLESSGLLEKREDSVPPMVVQMEYDGKSAVNACIMWYNQYKLATPDPDTHLWGMIENDGKAVVVGVTPLLLGDSSSMEMESMDENVAENADTYSEKDDASVTRHSENGDQSSNDYTNGLAKDMIPQLKSQKASIRLPASLLEKAIRRGCGLCSTAPLLEAANSLLLSTLDGRPIHGATLAFLNTAWKCTLVDASPFESDSPITSLGTECFCLLSLVAKVSPTWQMPPSLRRAAVAGVLRVARSPRNQTWVGHVKNDENWYKLEEEPKCDQLNYEVSDRAKKFRNILRVAQIAVGGRLAWGKWNKFVGDASAAAVMSYLNFNDWNGSNLEQPERPSSEEKQVLGRWENGCNQAMPMDRRLCVLDEECRLSAIEPTIFPHSLVLLQALLKSPPTSWKKHGLPSLARQVRKLISDVNPRIQERMQLQRLETWGKVTMIEAKSALTRQSLKVYKSYREAATTTGTLSEKEIELVECYEAIQEWQKKRFESNRSCSEPTGSREISKAVPVKAGKPLNEFDGRMAFLLAFGFAIEVEVSVRDRPMEKVSTMFCGTRDEPLLVQRIGKARKEGQDLAVSGGTMSGASAVPSLGYVHRSRSTEEAELFAAAEKAVATYWKGGRLRKLPLPPPLFQWEIGNEQEGDDAWDSGDPVAMLQADLREDGWHFSVDDVQVAAFDARNIISPCSLEIDDTFHRPVPLQQGSRCHWLVSTVLYLGDSADDREPQAKPDLPHGKIILDALIEMQDLAKSDRMKQSDEGKVYNWLPFAKESPIPSRTWRDALLAIRTRDLNHVFLGKGIQTSGIGTARDMSEGVLLRIFHVLEFLYPTAVRKDGALTFRIRPKGAVFYHLMACLENLSISKHSNVKDVTEKALKSNDNKKRKESSTEDLIAPPPKKRPRRAAAQIAAKKLSNAIAQECMPSEGNNGVKSHSNVDHAPIPKITTTLWPHQLATVTKIVNGVKTGKRGHADASSVGAGKTLTALATIVALQDHLEKSGHTRQGVLVMLPSKALIKEWLLEVATHSRGFHAIEQREDGSLFSLTYGKSHPPIDANALVISTLDRVCRHPFVRDGVCWDFVVIDECLAVQNSAAKRNPSAWRQIETSKCGVLMLSATFFRSKYDQLFYMIRMLRSPLPRTMEYLPATIHEHIVCQVPESDRSWEMKVEWAALKPDDMKSYRQIIDAFKRKQLNENFGDGRLLWSQLEAFLRIKYEGRTKTSNVYSQNSVMSEAFVSIARKLVNKKRRPLIFADTAHELKFLQRVLNDAGLRVKSWSEIASQTAPLTAVRDTYDAIVANKFSEAQGINMQRHADCVICRPTPGDLLEQMKGRIDRFGQMRKDLLLVVVVAEHTTEEAKFANIRLAGNFFREYIAPVATKYKERVDLEATLAVTGSKKLMRGTVSGVWRKSLEIAGQSGAFAEADGVEETPSSDPDKHTQRNETKEEPKYKPRNTVIRNKGDPVAVREAKLIAKKGNASLAIRDWLFPPKIKSVASTNTKTKQLPKVSSLRFSDTAPPLLLDRETIEKALAHLSRNDDRLASLIARVGADALVIDCGRPKPLTQAGLFDAILRAITFVMISVDAGNAFLRRLAMKAAVCLEGKSIKDRKKVLDKFVTGQDVVLTPDEAFNLLLEGRHKEVRFTHELLRELIDDCEVINGKQTGYPHLCGVSYPCGKHDDPRVFLENARDQARGSGPPVSAGYSVPKASFIIAAVDDMERGTMSASQLTSASDRKASEMLMNMKGIGDWSAGEVLMHTLKRADIMLYGDLTVRNYLNDLYDLGHQEESETWLESAADFPDNGPNRNLIDDLAQKNNWGPYRSVVCFLMYHLEEENLVLL